MAGGAGQRSPMCGIKSEICLVGSTYISECYVFVEPVRGRFVSDSRPDRRAVLSDYSAVQKRLLFVFVSRDFPVARKKA